MIKQVPSSSFHDRNFTQSSSGGNPYLIPHLRHSHTIEHLYFIFNSAELYKSGRRVRGVYLIDPDDLGAFNVYCDQTTAGGGQTVIQERMDGSVNFNRTQDDHKHGFSNLVGEFWLGPDKINRLTRNKTKKKKKKKSLKLLLFSEYLYF